jgi:hypothetical protein
MKKKLYSSDHDKSVLKIQRSPVRIAMAKSIFCVNYDSIECKRSPATLENSDKKTPVSLEDNSTQINKAYI